MENSSKANATKPNGDTTFHDANAQGAATAMLIAKERWNAYRYTNKGNLVATISNGSAIDIAGNVGAMAAKPVMENRAMEYRIYADIESFDIELATEEADKLIADIQALAPTFGGIDLEGIKSPDCFYIERRLKELLEIPVLCGTAHGTATSIAAAIINSCKTDRKGIKEMRIVIAGNSAKAIATERFLPSIGVDKGNIAVFGNKEAKAESDTLSQAMKNADIFICFRHESRQHNNDILSMARNAIVLALDNASSVIDSHYIKDLRPDIIIATQEPETPNCINPLLALPYLFRGALDTLSTTINDSMMLAAAESIARIAQESRQTLVPKVDDRRLLCEVSTAVAKATMESGIARRRIKSFDEYCRTLQCRVDDTKGFNSEIVRYRTQRHLNYGRWKNLEEF